ncbi:MAG TPA: 3-hydroxyacyl-CoA dehydrogenase family protein [Aggregatilinea sp.]|jgi:3-hydroxybutyryl-CoA dehydrogenase|uniref:3-hydroxyacyl-CoA dehydrogenase family protein n=1 Tax=Aggregatilinea sp. TaxID=2806333 RepID=UPI002B71BC38|nr:3-hydroxyacyl-CoA dehydrogenase family protein [Aggregatilinea sp.]HML24455.1 3-hydroxyacyl-CoA dehydrogenase family protein [Aggregatilinea sp.]
MRVLIVGEVPFVDALAGLCRAKNHKVDLFLSQDLEDQETLDAMVKAATRAQIAIESLNESQSAKMWLVEGIEANIPPDTPMLVSALAASATEIASWAEYPNRVVGYGLLPPVVTAGLVEFAPALQTDFDSATRARRFWEELGFEVVRVPDTLGLVRARIVCNLVNEAVYTLAASGNSVEDIDTAMRLGMNFPRGPLSWADEIGLDVVAGVLDGLLRTYGDERYRPAPLLRQKIYAGQVGKKSGKGFYTY